MDKRHREAIRVGKRHGFRLVQINRRGAHLRFEHRRTGAVVICPGSPSTQGWLKKLAANMKRARRNER